MARKGSSLLAVKMDVRGLKGFSNKLKELAKQLENPRDFIEEAGRYMVNVTKHRILRSKRGPDGAAWVPLSEITAELKSSRTILFETGTLAESIVLQQATKRGFAVAATAPYAPYMHYGVKKPGGLVRKKDGTYVKPGPIPARPFMGFSEENVRRITKMLKAHLAGQKDTTDYAIGFE